MKTMKCESCPSKIRVLGAKTQAWHATCKNRKPGKNVPRYIDTEEA